MQSSILKDVFHLKQWIARSIKDVEAMQSEMKRITITLPDQTAGELEDWASQQGRPTANLAAYLIELGLNQAKEKEQFIPRKLKQASA